MASTIDANDLTESQFADHVRRARPLLIKGAVRHWPAHTKWRDADYLMGLVGSQTVEVRNAPLIERRYDRRREEEERHERDARQLMTFTEFLASSRGEESENWVIGPGALTRHAFKRGLAEERRCALLALAPDVGEFPFLTRYEKPAIYRHKSVYFHNGSYTDWHWHDFDETLMCQVLGTKTTLLLPVHEARPIREIQRKQLVARHVDRTRFPSFDRLRPLRVDVHEGDALYIPPWWVHAVADQAEGHHLGATVVWCWRSPWQTRLRAPWRMFRYNVLDRFRAKVWPL